MTTNHWSQYFFKALIHILSKSHYKGKESWGTDLRNRLYRAGRVHHYYFAFSWTRKETLTSSNIFPSPSTHVLRWYLPSQWPSTSCLQESPRWVQVHRLGWCNWWISLGRSASPRRCLRLWPPLHSGDFWLCLQLLWTVCGARNSPVCWPLATRSIGRDHLLCKGMDEKLLWGTLSPLHTIYLAEIRRLWDASIQTISNLQQQQKGGTHWANLHFKPEMVPWAFWFWFPILPLFWVHFIWSILQLGSLPRAKFTRSKQVILPNNSFS